MQGPALRAGRLRGPAAQEGSFQEGHLRCSSRGLAPGARGVQIVAWNVVFMARPPSALAVTLVRAPARHNPDPVVHNDRGGWTHRLSEDMLSLSLITPRVSPQYGASQAEWSGSQHRQIRPHTLTLGTLAQEAHGHTAHVDGAQRPVRRRAFVQT